MSATLPLTHTQLYEQAPALFTEEPHYEVSDKYHFIPTIDVITKISSYGWHPVSVQEAGVRDIDKEGYQRHLVRFRHFDDLLSPKENAVELLLFNSHDRTTAFSISKKGGPRDIPLFDSALPYLEDQIAWAQEERSEYLFFNKDGRRLSDSKDIRGEKGKKGFYWNDYLEKLNIIPIRRMMNTRHTFAVHCIRNMDKLNLSLNDIASIMGHSTLRMLLQHYAKYLGDKNNHISRSISIF